MKGSWAGAMGQTQFMPSSFLEYAVDFEGHGRRDIWGSAPDAIGSTANYLAKHGWIAGAALGFRGHACRAISSSTVADQARLRRRSPPSPRAASRAPTAKPLPSEGEAQTADPGRAERADLPRHRQFQGIRTYNNSTAYALGVALLGDAATGRRRRRARIGRRTTSRLPQQDVREMQRELHRRGYRCRRASTANRASSWRRRCAPIRNAIGAPPDGYPTLALLRRLRDARLSGLAATDLPRGPAFRQSRLSMSRHDLDIAKFVARAARLAAVAAFGVALGAPSAPAQDRAAFGGFLQHLFGGPQRAAARRRPTRKSRRRKCATSCRRPRPASRARRAARRCSRHSSSTSSATASRRFTAGGLTEAFADKPEIAVLDKTHDASGLVRADYYDWRKGASDLATGKDQIDFVVDDVRHQRYAGATRRRRKCSIR